MSRRTFFAIALVSLLAPHTANAERIRRRFDPEDLDLEDPGDAHIDLELGVIRGSPAGRWVIPDFGLDVGLASNVELGLDGAFAIEGTESAVYAFDHPAPDNLWFSSKIGVFDFRDATGASWAGGVQFGPKIPFARDARGVGAEGLLLFGRTIRGTHIVVNAGGFVDPGDEIARGRPKGIEGGLDVDIDLDAKNVWSFVADVSAVYLFADQPAQLQTTFGPEWVVDDRLSLSVQALFGILPENDRYGALVVVSPTAHLFR